MKAQMRQAWLEVRDHATLYWIWDHLGIVITTMADYESRGSNDFQLGVNAERAGLTASRTAATPAAVNVMRMVAEVSGQDLDALASEYGVDLTDSTMADLNRLGRVIGEGMAGVSNISVGLPATPRAGQ